MKELERMTGKFIFIFAYNQSNCCEFDLIFSMPFQRIYVVVICLFASRILAAQEILEQLATKLTTDYSKNSKELIILQTDKAVYQPGTEIWFRVSALSSNGFVTDAQDKIIYVELTDDKNKTIERVLLNKAEQQYNGSLLIPHNSSTGFYQLRAYTKTILQKHPSDIFVRGVYISGKDDRDELQSQPLSKPVYRFYIEGDQLINGVNCTVVFTAMDIYGNALPVTGHVKDNFGNEVVRFTGTGLGKFLFQPYSKDRVYKVFIKSNDSEEQSFSLPPIKTGAFQLSLQNQTNNELVFRVALGDSVYNKKANSYLVGVGGGKICFASEGKGMYMVNVPLNTLPHGLVDFYLFDANKELKSKRTVFNRFLNTAVNFTADRPDYGPRQKAKLDIVITDNAGKPVKAVFSVAVTDKKLAGASPLMHEADIYRLNLQDAGSWLQAALDNEETKDMLAVVAGIGKSRLNHPPEVDYASDLYLDGLQIKGRVFDKQGTSLNGEIVMLIPEQLEVTLNDSTDNNGLFEFRDIVFYGRQRFLVMIPSVFDKQQKYEVTKEENDFPLIATNRPHRYDLGSLQNLQAFRQAQADSVISGNTRNYLQQLALQEHGAGKKTKKGNNQLLSGRRITGEQLDKFSLSNTVDAVKMLPGVVMMSGRLTLQGGMPGIITDLSDLEPFLIVDGVNTRTSSVVDYLNSIPPSNIDYIEVLSGPEAAMYGSRGGNGAIVVKTSNQLREKKFDGKDMQTIIASGFYKDQNFYMPPYDKYSVREASFTDNRATIYWNGQVITDSTGKAGVSFYTADLKNDYTVTLQGMTDKGELIFKTYTIKKR